MSPKMGQCKFLLKTDKGRQINITLIDFYYNPPNPRHQYLGNNHLKDKHNDTNSCLRYAFLRDLATVTSTTRTLQICGKERHRFRHIHTSEGNLLEITTFKPFSHHKHDNDFPRFLIKYEAIGCADLDKNGLEEAKKEAWTWNRNGDQATITCDEGGLAFSLVCLHGKWDGKFTGCSSNKEVIDSGL